MLATGPRSSSRTWTTSSSARLDRWESGGGGASGSGGGGAGVVVLQVQFIDRLTFSCSSSSSSPGCARAVHRQSAGHFSCAQRGTHSANCAEDCSWRRRPCDQQRQFPQSRGSNLLAHPQSGEHSCCAQISVEIPQVQFLGSGKLLTCPYMCSDSCSAVSRISTFST